MDVSPSDQTVLCVRVTPEMLAALLRRLHGAGARVADVEYRESPAPPRAWIVAEPALRPEVAGLSPEPERPVPPPLAVDCGKDVVTLIGEAIDAGTLAAAIEVIVHHGAPLRALRTLSAEAPLCAIELHSDFDEKADAIKAALLIATEGGRVDVAVQRAGANRRAKRLAVFDVDSTLIEEEVIDEIARALGCYPKVAAITERAMRGELDFRAALAARVALFKGARLEDLVREVTPRLHPRPGARELLAALKRSGCRVVAVSGGFDVFVEPLRAALGIDEAFANALDTDGGVLTGRVRGAIVDRARKAEILETLAAREGLSLDQVLAVGDGANDLSMLLKAGLGVAFNAKPAVRAAARVAINQLHMGAIWYLLGAERKAF